MRSNLFFVLMLLDRIWLSSAESKRKTANTFIGSVMALNRPTNTYHRAVMTLSRVANTFIGSAMALNRRANTHHKSVITLNRAANTFIGPVMTLIKPAFTFIKPVMTFNIDLISGKSAA